MTKVLGATSIPPALEPLAPFFHDIDLGEAWNTAPDRYRVANALNLFFPILTRLCGGSLRGKRVLDLGCNCGGFSFAAARLGASEVVGVDVRARHIEQAERIREFLGIENVKFVRSSVEEMNADTHGVFDVGLLFGLIYHLSDPLGVMAKLHRMVRDILVVDSHVHYSSDPTAEDIASWWMLADCDRNDLDGLYEGDARFSPGHYLAFEGNTPVPYEKLPSQFEPSPHTARDLQFLRQVNPRSADPEVIPESLGAPEPGALVLVPNKKALIRILRLNGFEDIIELTPHRFSEEPYIRRYRVGLIGVRRQSGGGYAQSVWGKGPAATR